MANVCSSCRSDNADGALVCRQCGAALTPAAAWSRSLIPEDDTFDPLSAPTLVMQHTAPAGLPDIEETQPVAPEGSTGRRLVWGLAGFIVLLGAGLWLLRPAGEEPAPVQPSAPLAAASAVAASVAPSPSPAPEPSGAALPAVPPVPATAATAAAAASAAVAAEVAAPAMPSPAAPASAVDRRKRIPEPVVRRPVPASAPAASAAEPVIAPLPASTPAPAAEPVRPRAVAELCAGSNLLTRGFCEHRECARAEYAGDPVCTRLKEAEEARRFRQ